MQIYGTSQLHGAQSISGPHASRPTPNEQVSSTTSTGDRLDISAAGELAGKLSEIPDIRHDRVQALRTAIQNGTYETHDKLNAAVDRLLDEIA